MKYDPVEHGGPGPVYDTGATQAGTQWVDVVFQDGCLTAQDDLLLPNGTPVHLQIVLPDETGQNMADPRVKAYDGVSEGNAIRLSAPVDLPEGTRLRLHLTLQAAGLAILPTERAQEIAETAPSPAATGGVIAAPAPSAPRERWRLRLPAWKRPSSTMEQSAARQGLLTALTRLDVLLLTTVMVVYLLVRLIGLTQFPIFFSLPTKRSTPTRA